MRRFTRCVTDQNSSSIVAADSKADMVLTASAADCIEPPKRVMKKRAANINIGLPGG